ncbi:MAG: DedA family protein [Dermabacter sp.]|nr:DedA family protein [Dermabacter sp.]
MNIVDWSVHIMSVLGGPGVMLLLLIECVFPPIPSEVILPLAGVTAGTGDHNFFVLLLWSIAGSMAGAYLLYGVGRALGPERTRQLFIKLPLITLDDYNKTSAWIDKHGMKGVFFGRFVPGIRSLISVPAGMFAMKLPMFSLLTFAGSAIWNSIFLSFGFFLGTRWHVIEPYTDIFSKVAYAVVALVILVIAARLVMREVKRKKAGLPDPDENVQ